MRFHGSFVAAHAVAEDFRPGVQLGRELHCPLISGNCWANYNHIGTVSFGYS